MSSTETDAATAPAAVPRLGFLGVGWIGRHRMQAVARDTNAVVAAVADMDEEAATRAAVEVACATTCGSVAELLELDLDGVVIATPSALHAEQAVVALERGIAVFVQKPLARTEQEARRVVDAARANDVLLAVDMSYRFVRAVAAVRDVVRSGQLGRVYAADLYFHNSYGPDKSWFLDPISSGGGCVIDLGTHLIDLALWILSDAPTDRLTARLFADGAPLRDPRRTVEDHALVQLDLRNGATVRVACSWFLPAGRDARIGATFFGSNGGVAFQNVAGSFYDFRAVRLERRATTTVVDPPDDWGGRAIVDWVARLARGGRFDGGVEDSVTVARLVDRIYGRAR